MADGDGSGDRLGFRSPGLGQRGTPAPIARTARTLLVLACLLLVLPGCGAIALIHDAYLGPISPAGKIHPLVIGTEFRVGPHGPEAVPSEVLLLPIPQDLLLRISTLIPLSRGLRAAVASFSLVVGQTEQRGREVLEGEVGGLHPGMAIAEALRLLGCPRQWLMRKEGSVLVYSSDLTERLGVRIGLPPGVSQLIPIPGVGALTFRYLEAESLMTGWTLFFDRRGRLSSWGVSAARE